MGLVSIEQADDVFQYEPHLGAGRIAAPLHSDARHACIEGDRANGVVLEIVDEALAVAGFLRQDLAQCRDPVSIAVVVVVSATDFHWRPFLSLCRIQSNRWGFILLISLGKVEVRTKVQ